MERIIRLWMLCLVIFTVSCTHGESIPADHIQTGAYHAELVWQTEAVFQTPEAVLYDAKRDVLYVSNFRKTDPNLASEFISRVDTDGNILDLKWITELNRPTGLTIYQDKLYVVERTNLVCIDINSARIEKRYPISEADFPNDVVFDPHGVGYISNNGRNGKTSIFRFKDERIEPWLSSDQVLRPNGLLIEGEYLIAYDNLHKALVRIHRDSQKIEEIAKIASDATAMGDGLVKLDVNTYLVTAWDGPSWIVEQDGGVTDFVNTDTLTQDKKKRVNHADIGLVSQKNLWIIPTFSNHRLLAYKWSKNQTQDAPSTTGTP